MRPSLRVLALVAAGPLACAQASTSRRHIERLSAVPLGALPPVPTQMPASRNHNYWGVHAQGGRTGRTDAADLTSYAGGIDFQWRGGSVFGLTGGYQTPECPSGTTDCGDGHALVGLRGRFNVVTAGPTLGGIAGDYSASTTLGAELGFGYASGVGGAAPDCAIDFGVPVSEAMLQRIRLVWFVSPGIAWDVGCKGTGAPGSLSLYSSLGVGIQQLWHRGLDVSFGLQRIFRGGAGLQLGLTISYIRLP
jgi:hypothetical protein